MKHSSIVALVIVTLASVVTGCSATEAASDEGVLRETKGELVAETVTIEGGYSTRLLDVKKGELGTLEWNTRTKKVGFLAKAAAQSVDVAFATDFAPSAHAANRIAFRLGDLQSTRDTTARMPIGICCDYIGYGGMPIEEHYDCYWWIGECQPGGGQ